MLRHLQDVNRANEVPGVDSSVSPLGLVFRRSVAHATASAGNRPLPPRRPGVSGPAHDGDDVQTLLIPHQLTAEFDDAARQETKEDLTTYDAGL